MDAQALMTVSATVVTLTQMVKWGGLPDSKGPFAVALLSLLGILFWGYSVGNLERATAFAYFSGFVVVMTSAAGVFGFTRAASSAVTAAKSPPGGGAGSNVTEKPD